MSADIVIEARGLAKRFGKLSAVDGLDLIVRRGEVYGFLGLNGAGKTTTLRMLLGLLRPDAGSIALFGQPMAGGRWPLERIGASLETPGMYENLSAEANLEIRRKMLHLPPSATADALEAMDLGRFADAPFRQLSSGNRRRLSIAAALLSQPELLILDEPTNALDPAGIRSLRELIVRLAEQRGVTVVVSSHVLAEVQRVASRIGIIHEGRMVDEMDLDAVQKRSRAYLELRVSDPARAVWVLEEKLGAEEYAVHEHGVLRLYEQLDSAASINAELVSAGVGVSGLAMRSTGLEDHFMALTGGEASC